MNPPSESVGSWGPGAGISIQPMVPLAPPFRLSEVWYWDRMRQLQVSLQQEGLDAIILEDVWNIIYFSGFFHAQTERPLWLVVPAEGEPIIFFPGLDRDLVKTWWIEDGEWYFEYPHHGPYNQAVFEPGPREDLLQWMLGRLAHRGFERAMLGIEREVGEGTASRMQRALPNATFRVVGDICLRMRQIKTAEEITLIGQGVALQDHIYEFMRGLILEHGTDITDFDVRLEAERYATHLLMQWVKPDGRPHHGVGIDVRFRCRAGVTTAYPHDNQFNYHKIGRGDAIQIRGYVRIGGYAGEGYRALQTEPMTDLHKRMWEVHTEMTLLQAELCRVGMRCNEIASRVFQVATDAGLEEYIYHRPAHGIGMEGHQAPYLSLGDETLLEENMVFSNEIGLYNPRGGWGYNHSNTVVVSRERGRVLNKTPLSKEWCWLQI